MTDDPLRAAVEGLYPDGSHYIHPGGTACMATCHLYDRDVLRAALAASATDVGPRCTCMPFFTGHVTQHPDCPLGRREAAHPAASLVRPAAPVALDAGTYEELLASRDALQDDYNALSDEHDKCPAVPEALDVKAVRRVTKRSGWFCDGDEHASNVYEKRECYCEKVAAMLTPLLAREYAALAVSAPDEGPRADPWQVIHDHGFSWDDVNALASIFAHEGWPSPGAASAPDEGPRRWTPGLHGSDEPPQYPDDEDGDDWAPDDVCPKCGKPWDAASAPDEGLHPEDCHNQTHIALDDARDEIARLRAARPAVPALDVIASKVTALAHLTPEDWAERRGADPIARTINAVLDIIREAR